MTFKREFFIPSDATKVTCKVSGAEAYLYSTDCGRTAALAFGGRRQKPDWHFIFPNEEKRTNQIKKYFKAQSEIKISKMERRKKMSAPHDWKVGDIMYTSWGYSMTFVDFYQIVELKGKATAIVRKLAKKEHDENGGGWYGHVSAIKDSFVTDDIKIRVRQNTGNVEGQSAWKWDGSSKYWNHLD